MFSRPPAVRWDLAGFVGALVLGIVTLGGGALNPALAARPISSLLAFGAGFLWLSLPWTGPPTRRLLERLVLASPRWRFNLALAVLTTLVATAVSWALFQGVPHLDDSVSALFQAKIFATGRLTVPIPEGGDFFSMWCNIDARHGRGHMCSMYPPGHALILLPGLLLGVPWLVTPLFGGALVVATHELAARLYGRRVGRLSGLFAMCSPFVLMLSGTHLSHVPTAFLVVSSMWAIVRLRSTSRWVYGLAAGVCFALAFVTRPLTALGAGGVIALGALGTPECARRRWKGLVVGAMLAIVAAGSLAAWQREITGDWRTSGHSVSLGDSGRLGFREDQAYTPRVAWEHTRLRLRTLGHRVLGWPIPLFVVVLAPFLLMRAAWSDVWLLLVPLTLLGLYCFYYYLEFFFPARYIFSGVPMLIVLAARGYDVFANRLGETFESLGVWLPAALLGGCLTFAAWVYGPTYFESIPSNYGDVEARLARVIEGAGVDDAIVFMSGVDRLPEGTNNDLFNDFYATGFLRNDVDFAGPVLFARSYEGYDHLLAALHPERRYYLYRYNRARDRGRIFRMTFDGEAAILDPIRIEGGE